MKQISNRSNLSSLLCCLLGLLFVSRLSAQPPKIHILDSGKATNLRGISYSSDGQIWVSGSNGYTAQSKDGGRTWRWHLISHFQNRDFRDIQALGHNTAITIGVDTPAIILRTSDGGQHWQKVYENNRPGMFLDALDFIDNKTGAVLGDPVNNHPFILFTKDAGLSWHEKSSDLKEQTKAGEAFFAASGTNIILTPNANLQLISGGTTSRFWKEGFGVIPLPFQQAVPTAGPNGMAIKGNIIAVVGGDFTHPENGDSALAISYNRGLHWQAPKSLPGYGSGVAVLCDSTIVCRGLRGVWISYNAGSSWSTISSQPFNSILYLEQSKKIFLVGPNGSIAVIEENRSEAAL